MKIRLAAIALAAFLIFLSGPSFSGVTGEKDHDFIPRFHNLIFLFDVSDSMQAGYPRAYDFSRMFVATRAFMMFNAVMPHVPHWQYDLNTALVTFGDCKTPRLLGPLGPWTRVKYAANYACLRQEKTAPWRTAAFQDALQLAGSLIGSAAGRTAVVVFTDGGSMGECPQKTAIALKDAYGKKVQVYGIFFGGDREVGWRNLYEVCKLTGGYCRQWEEVRTKAQMQEFAWDVLVREIMFPYPEIFFKMDSPELVPSEALKLESVANFLHAIPQYVLQIDGHTTFFGDTRSNYQLGMQRARNVKDALVRIYRVDPARIMVRSWGEELPRYDNQNPDTVVRNAEANLYLMLPLRNYPYDEKKLHTFGVNAVGDIYNTQERYNPQQRGNTFGRDPDAEWAWPAKPPPGSPITGPVDKRNEVGKRLPAEVTPVGVGGFH
jgi:outer membrane protein OmpA-like peptidoglycan-associated protein